MLAVDAEGAARIAPARIATPTRTSVADYATFKKELVEKGGFFVTSWCQSKECEAKVKEETKATIRCLPLDAQKLNIVRETAPCMVCGGGSQQRSRDFC